VNIRASKTNSTKKKKIAASLHRDGCKLQTGEKGGGGIDPEMQVQKRKKEPSRVAIGREEKDTYMYTAGKGKDDVMIYRRIQKKKGANSSFRMES